jgi:hypothetical protein
MRLGWVSVVILPLAGIVLGSMLLRHRRGMGVAIVLTALVSTSLTAFVALG